MNPEFPQAFLDAMQTRLGSDLASWQAAMQQTPPVSIRLNPAKPFDHPDMPPVPWTAKGLYLPERPVFALDPLWHAGAYYVQEASSMLLEAAIPQDLRTQPIVALDLCGAPGGKSTHLQSLLHPESLVVANEVIRQRASILHENLTKWGGGNTVITSADPSRLGTVTELFDLILVDAPCSGEGMFRKDADAIGEWSPDHVQLCAARQTRILHDIWPALRPGGTLVYSTCTWNAQEDEAQINRLVREEGAEVLPLSVYDPAWGFLELPLDQGSGYLALPHRVQGEGFFLAVVRKPGDATSLSFGREKKLVRATRKEQEAAAHLLHEGWELFQHNGTLYALPRAAAAAADHLLQRMPALHVGVKLGGIKGKDFRPDPESAFWSKLPVADLPVADLDLEAALHFLRRDVYDYTRQKGWLLMRYRDIPLGWAKGLGNRVNNYFPQEWRLRKEL